MHDHEKIARGRSASTKQTKKDTWIIRLSLDREIGQGQNLTEHELAQDEYLINLRPQENLEHMYQQDKLEKNDQGQLRQLYRETKMDKLQKLRRKIEF